MGMPDLSDKENVPNMPQGSVNNQNLEAPNNRTNHNVSNASIRSNLDLKKDIIRCRNMETKQRLVGHVRFRTSTTQLSTLGEYVERMLVGQNDIYYMIGRNVNHLSHSPYVRRFVTAGLEVLFLIDPILDEQVVKKLDFHFGRYRLVSIKTERLEVPQLANSQDRKKRQREALDEFLPLCKRLKSVYSEQIEKIVISTTLVESTCAIIPSEEVPIGDDVPCYEINPGLGRIRLEINPDNDSLRLLCLQARVLEKKQEQFDDLVKLLFGPPTSEDSIVLEQPCSPLSDSS